MDHVITPPIPASVPVAGRAARFPVRRIYCVGRNYAEHAIEMGGTGREAPFFFMKPADAVLPVGADGSAAMPYPSLTRSLHHEVELVLALGSGGRDIPAGEALRHVWGCAVGLDMTRRDLQAEMKKAGRPWSIAKGFDASAPIGPLLQTDAAALQALQQASIDLKVNGTVRQHSTVDRMIWSLAEIIEHLSAAWTLAPGDLIFTGTPEGVAAVERGDVLEAAVAGLPPLRVEIVGAADR